MGAPKQKWTQEEEAALKAGVIKHGAGKWRTILKDPEFSGVLYLRSNVDLKDKWRNMSVMSNGWGSRDKSRLAVKRIPHIAKSEENSLALSSTIVQSDEEEIVDAKPLAVSGATPQIAAAPKRSIVRLDNLIMEAITTLKEPGGSNKTTIAAYIEEKKKSKPQIQFHQFSFKVNYISLVPMAAGAGCVVDTRRALECRNGEAAAHLKFVSVFIIFFTSVIGVSLPVVLARYLQGKPSYDKATLIIKCFAAGVILSTSLVHVLPDAFDALSDCQVASKHPWRDFPFAGLVTLIGALLALLVDITASAHVEHGHGHGHNNNDNKESKNYVLVGTQEEIEGIKKGNYELGKLETGHGERTNRETDQEELIKLKQKLVSQVLEIGIIFHSVIIGVTMGMSQNQCTIRPLVAALAFHQIFEGMGLGGCIAQAGFNFGTVAYMCFMFSATTPMGIVLGMIVFSVTGYDDSNPNALIMEGLLGALSSGILIYMGLVDLIAVDFFHNKLMSSRSWLKKASFIALALGSTSMSILALWA